MTAWTVRAARVEDAEGIARVAVDGWRAAYTGLMPQALLDGLSVEARTRAWRERLGDPAQAARTWVAVESDGEQVVGWMSVDASRDADDDPRRVGELWAIYVDPARWGGGAGKALLQQACAVLRARGFGEMTLWVLSTNARSRRWYEARGLRTDGGEKVTREGGADLPHTRYRMGLGGPRDEAGPGLDSGGGGRPSGGGGGVH